MKTDGFEHITLGELEELFKLDGLSVKEAIPALREFRDKHGFTDQQALAVFGIAERIYQD
jgi:hypothetical protein